MARERGSLPHRCRRALCGRRAHLTLGGRRGAVRYSLTAAALWALAGSSAAPAPPAGPWRAVLDLAGGALPFSIELARTGRRWNGSLCNGRLCEPFSAVHVQGDSLVLEMADYAATITAAQRGDSLTGVYRNVGNRGPRTIPFRAARGRWPQARAPEALVGRWDASFFSDFGSSPRIFELRNGPSGFEGTMISNTGDYGHFAGQVRGDSFSLAHFDGSFVYLLTGALHGDTLRGVFHAGLRTQTNWIALRSTGAPIASAEADAAPVRKRRRLGSNRCDARANGPCCSVTRDRAFPRPATGSRRAPPATRSSLPCRRRSTLRTTCSRRRLRRAPARLRLRRTAR